MSISEDNGLVYCCHSWLNVSPMGFCEKATRICISHGHISKRFDFKPLPCYEFRTLRQSIKKAIHVPISQISASQAQIIAKVRFRSVDHFVLCTLLIITVISLRPMRWKPCCNNKAIWLFRLTSESSLPINSSIRDRHNVMSIPWVDRVFVLDTSVMDGFSLCLPLIEIHLFSLHHSPLLVSWLCLSRSFLSFMTFTWPSYSDTARIWPRNSLLRTR